MSPHSHIKNIVSQSENRAAGSGIHVRKREDGVWLYSYGQVAGRHMAEAGEDRRVLLGVAGSGSLKMQLVAHKEDEEFFRHLDLRDREIAQAADHALQAISGSMNSLKDKEIRLTVLAAPVGSGRYIADASKIEESLHLVIAIGVPQDIEVGALPIWGEAITWASHELFHAHHRLIGTGVEKIDEETAAYLAGYCVQARFAQALGRGLEATISLPTERIRSAFPRIEEGVFDPQMEYLEHLGDPHASAQARSLALAALSVYGDYPSTQLGNRNATRELLNACDHFAYGIPRFSAGELH